MKKIILFSIAFLICSPHLAFSQQTVSLSTYYPAPFGAYDRLRLVPRDEILGVCRVGTFYTRNTDNTLRYCREVGGGEDAGAWGYMDSAWTQLGDDVFLTDGASNPNLSVGIGTTTPLASLHIVDVGASIRVQSTNPLSNSGITFQSASGSFSSVFYNPNGNIFGIHTTEADADITFGTKPASAPFAERMRIIGATGNVGIGTTDPKARLHIQGTSSGAVLSGMLIGTTAIVRNDAAPFDDAMLAIVGGVGPAGTANITFGDANNVSEAGIAYNNFTHTMTISTNSNTPANSVTIDPNGNVGIGTTTSPFAQLTVLQSDNGIQAITGQVTDGTAILAEGATGYVSYKIHNVIGGINQFSTWGLADGPGIYSSLATNGDTILRADTEDLIFTANNAIRFAAKRPVTDLERMTILSNGRVGIGTTIPDALFTVNGTASKPGGGVWLGFSDSRLKTDLGPFQAGLEEVLKLKPVRYRYRKDNALGLVDDREYIGLNAEEVKEVIPEAVNEADNGYLMLNQNPILWAMLNAIKEQQEEIQKLHTLIQNLSDYAT